MPQAFLQAPFDRAVVALLIHVDEIDDDQPGEVAQSKLPRHFLGGLLDHFGAGVRLSNVRLEELLRVEIYRRGLHSDAFAKPGLRPPPPAERAAQGGKR